MKKKLITLALGLIATLGFSLNASAATPPSSIKVAPKRAIGTVYVSEFLVSYKNTTDNKNIVYCDEINKEYPGGLTLQLGNKLDKGYVYILQNQPKTSNKDRDYYIMQSAFWWYKELLSPTNDYTIQNFIKNCTSVDAGNSVCVEVLKLVNGAKNYKEPVGSVSFSSNDVTFTKSGEYLVSSTITLNSANLKSLAALKLNNAPDGSTIINSNISNNKGTFQVRVPLSSLNAGSTVSFTVSVSGSYDTYAVYDYFYNSKYQRVIFEEIYTTPKAVSASKTLKVTRSAENSLTIRKVDQDGKLLSGAGLTLYKGNCLTTSCGTLTVYGTWTTALSAKVFKDLPKGDYTIVETNTPKGYQTAEKGLITISRDDVNYTYTVVNVKETEVKPVKIEKLEKAGNTYLPGATLVIKNAAGKVIEKWVSEDLAKYIILAEGEYTLEETKAPIGYKLNKEVIYFKVDKEGNLTVKNETGKYENAEEVKLINEKTDMVVINKLDKNTNDFLAGAVLEIKDSDGNVISTWTTKNESYSISLKPGLYSIRETNTPKGYEDNKEIIYFKVSEDGTLLIRNDNGGFDIAGGIIIYNIPEDEYEEIIEVPKTGLTSTLTYIVGTMTMVGGAVILRKNEKNSI